MASNNVIIFGPTGNIASVAARTAQKHGAKVFLAMRDTKKEIQGLSAEAEAAGGFERIEADLTKPDTVEAAIKKSGAKRAFFYVAHGMPDHMKSTIQAFKSGGVELPVFLSSFTIIVEPDEVPPEEIIPYIHSTVEINLREIYGEKGFVAVRPGSFATNLNWVSKGISNGEVKMPYPEAKADYVTPKDMGEVSGTILAKGTQDGQNIVYLFGPDMISQQDAVEMLAKALDKDVKITPVDYQEGVDLYRAAGMPGPVPEYIMKRLSKTGDGMKERPNFKEGVENVQKYTGHPATKFEDWLKDNTHVFKT